MSEPNRDYLESVTRNSDRLMAAFLGRDRETPPPIRHILLDMDGVLCDFVSMACVACGRPAVISNWPKSIYPLCDALEMPLDEIWARIDRHDKHHGFWSRLAPYPWYTDLINLIIQQESFNLPFTISTSPSRHHGCVSGKVQWLRRHIHPGFTDYMLGHQKHLLAKPDVCLIDDSDMNVDNFRTAGGKAILFPQPWNSNHADELLADRVAYVERDLRKMVSPEVP